MTMHYHYATGIPGYGPDGADGFATADNLNQLAEAVREEIRFLIGFLYDTADAHADMGEFETAWQTHKRMEAFENLSANLNTDRQNAPLYRNDPDAWEATLRNIIDENFPLAVIDGSQALYVWTCNEGDCECEHLPHALIDIREDGWAALAQTERDAGTILTFTDGETEWNDPLRCPDCASTNVTPAHGHHLAKCDSCHLAFDTMD